MEGDSCAGTKRRGQKAAPLAHLLSNTMKFRAGPTSHCLAARPHPVRKTGRLVIPPDSSLLTVWARPSELYARVSASVCSLPSRVHIDFISGSAGYDRSEVRPGSGMTFAEPAGDVRPQREVCK